MSEILLTFLPMLSLNDLLELARAENMPVERRRGIVREYLQTLILFCLQKSRWASNFIFIGGTALRFFHNSQRFSEDLDFNYQGVLKKSDLEKILKEIQRELKNENIDSNFSIHKSAETYFHWKVYLQFPEVLQAYGCAGKKVASLYPEEKLSIQLDFQNIGSQKYPVEQKIIARFGKRFIFNTISLNLFLAEKSNAILYRKSPRGRDFFDYMSLVLWGAKADMKLLEMREIKVKDKAEYIEKMCVRAGKTDFKKLAVQLSPFLFRLEDVQIMENFGDYFLDLLKKV